MEIFDQLSDRDIWEEFIEYKKTAQHLKGDEFDKLRAFIDSGRYLEEAERLSEDSFELPIPRRSVISKIGGKKRTVYTYPDDFNYMLKLISFLLHRYDGIFADSCYAFRKGYGVKDAVKRLRGSSMIKEGYCVKIDISNYFNSIDCKRLIGKLDFLKKDDKKIYDLFVRMLTQDKAFADGVIIEGERGAMAGVPVASFFANVYLSELDHYYEKKDVPYFRYSDDIILFGGTREDAEVLRDELFAKVEEEGLSINPDKVSFRAPGEGVEFLGFSFRGDEVDLSVVTLNKMKARIRRKSRALIRWGRRKELEPRKAAKGFVKAMNYKFFDAGTDDEFSWSRWFFPNINTDCSLRVIDSMMQEYIRYTLTGRHYKGNYRISYEELKELGYRNLVHEFHKFHSDRNYGKIRESSDQ